MNQPWVAEVEVSPERAVQLITTQFPGVPCRSIELIGEGWDNTAYLVDGEWVFRFPRRTQAAPLMDTECRILPLLAPRIPVQMPHPVYVGEPEDGFPWRFAGYRKLEGKMACRAQLSDEQRIAIAPSLGKMLRALHGVKALDAAAWGARPDALARLDFNRRLPRILEILSRVASHVPRPEEIERLVREAAAATYHATLETLSHGDLYCRHLLVDENAKLSGVIDWGDVHLGDPAADLMIAYTLLPAGARDGFFEEYGRVPDATLRAARYRGAFHSLYVLDYAIQIGDEDLGRESRTAIVHVLA
jgi:aminoglycoside phosphotransferase (APT) family kinase protein